VYEIPIDPALLHAKLNDPASTLVSVAEFFGRDQSTIRRWRASEAYRAYQRELHAAIMTAVVDQISDGVIGEMLQKLIDIARGGDNDSTRLGAIRQIMELRGITGEAIATYLAKGDSPDQSDDELVGMAVQAVLQAKAARSTEAAN
jgi:hypothetical protein